MVDFFRRKRKDGDRNDDSDDDEGQNPFESIFKNFFNDDFFKEIQRMQREMAEQFGSIDENEFKRMESLARKTGGKPMVWGFSIKTGPDGKPTVEQFGNVEPEEKEIRQEREPLCDLIDKEREISVLAELPGVEKGEIRLSLDDGRNNLIINAPGKFHKKVKLPAKVKPNLGRATYKNGILEVNLEKEKPAKPKGTEIKVE